MALHKIGKRAKTAKKYADLRAKQKMANQILYGAKKHLKQDHKAIKQALERKRLFYKNRGLKNPPKLSFKNLTAKDLKAYEQLLDSIINNTYLNPDKYEEHIKKIKENVSQQVLDAFEGSAEDYDEFMDSDIFKQLIDLGIDPSTLVRYMQEMYENGFTLDDFIKASKEFIELMDEGNYGIDEYFSFMDEWQDKQDGGTGDIQERARKWYEETHGKGKD